MLSAGKLPFKLVLKTTKGITVLVPKKEASFIFETRLHFHSLVVYPYLGWESNPHDIATTGF